MRSYWMVDGRCGLEGGQGTWEEHPIHGMVLVPYQGNPAQLPDDFILFGLKQSRAARYEFKRIYPSLSPEAKERLTNLLGPKLMVDLEEDPMKQNDIRQSHAIRSIPVRTAGRRGGGSF